MNGHEPALARLSSALIVEDQPDAQAWLKGAVEASFPSLTITTAATLAEARRAVASNDPDLALVDLGLPDGSGLDLMRELSAAGSNCIMVVTTVFGDDQHLFAALRAGAQGYILKDESRDHLAGMLKEIVSGKPPLSPPIARRVLAHFHDVTSGEEGLTDREREVLSLLAKGLTVAKAADLLGITRNTAAGYAKDVYRKLKVTSRAEAAVEAMRRGLV